MGLHLENEVVKTPTIISNNSVFVIPVAASDRNTLYIYLNTMKIKGVRWS